MNIFIVSFYERKRWFLIELYHKLDSLSSEKTNFFLISLEESQEAGLSAGRALDPAESEVVAGVLQITEVHQQVLSPQTGPLTHRGQLGRPTSYSISNS